MAPTGSHLFNTSESFNKTKIFDMSNWHGACWTKACMATSFHSLVRPVPRFARDGATRAHMSCR